jgi:hypothetical protein
MPACPSAGSGCLRQGNSCVLERKSEKQLSPQNQQRGRVKIKNSQNYSGLKR